MRIATMMSIAVLGLSGAAIAQVTTPPDQATPPTMQNQMGNNMATPDDTMGNDMMLPNTMDNETDEMDSMTPTIPDTMPPTTAPTPDGTTTTPDDTGETP